MCPSLAPLGRDGVHFAVDREPSIAPSTYLEEYEYALIIAVIAIAVIIVMLPRDRISNVFSCGPHPGASPRR